MPIHKNLSSGEWQKLSFFQQMANIGSEFFRFCHWHEIREKSSADASAERVLELLDLSNKNKELSRLREIFCDLYLEKGIYNVNVQDLEKYFMQFALVARKDK